MRSIGKIGWLKVQRDTFALTDIFNARHFFVFAMVNVISSMVKVIFLMVDVIFPMVNVISLMVNDIFSMVKKSCVLMVNNVKGFNSYLGQKSFIRQEAGRRFFHLSYSELFLSSKITKDQAGRRFVRCFNFQA